MVCVSTTESRVWSCSTHNHMTSVRQVTVRLTRVKPAGDGGILVYMYNGCCVLWFALTTTHNVPY